jgi:phage-related protein
MAKTLKGFGGGSVVEVRQNHEGNIWRAFYTVRFVGGVYVLHASQKKSITGRKTAKPDLNLIGKRLN